MISRQYLVYERRATAFNDVACFGYTIKLKKECLFYLCSKYTTLTIIIMSK